MSFELILSCLRPIALVLDKGVSETQEPNISSDAGRLRLGLAVIANQLGARLDEDDPFLDAHLPDASRLRAAIAPVVCRARSLTIRKFTGRHYTIDGLLACGTLTRPLADFLAGQIRSGKTRFISGFSDSDAEIGEAVGFVLHVERQPGRRILRETWRIAATTAMPNAS